MYVRGFGCRCRLNCKTKFTKFTNSNLSLIPSRQTWGLGNAILQTRLPESILPATQGRLMSVGRSHGSASGAALLAHQARGGDLVHRQSVQPRPPLPMQSAMSAACPPAGGGASSDQTSLDAKRGSGREGGAHLHQVAQSTTKQEEGRWSVGCCNCSKDSA